MNEDLEKNRPLVQTGFDQKKVGQVERTTNELPVGAIVKKGANDTIGGLALSEEWKNAFKEIQPEYLYKQQHIKLWTKNVQSNKNKRTICCNWKNK